MADDRLPTGLRVEATLQGLTLKGTPFYYAQKGNHASGLVMLKLSNMRGICKLITEQRNFMTDKIEWINALNQEEIEERAADDYIKRSIENDPDLWVIEIEDEAMLNPFEEQD